MAAPDQDAPVTDRPGVLHPSAQPVVRDGVPMLTDRPLSDDEHVPGRRVVDNPVRRW